MLFDLPQELQSQIEILIGATPPKKLKEAAGQITEHYRLNPKQALVNEARYLAYLTVRMPATFASFSYALKTAAFHLQQAEVQSLCDIGSGPGTVLWACAEQIKSLKQATCLELNRDLSLLGQRLAQKSALAFITSAKWLHGSASLMQLPISDLITFSYSLGEMEETESILKNAWEKTRDTLIIIEPGTPKGFDLILRARAFFLKAGAHLIAPCPHENKCPLLATPNWCHFAVRLNRHPLHVKTKEATLPYEDEKFSYLIVSKRASTFPFGRLLHQPFKHKGHVKLSLCTAAGLLERVVSKKNKELYIQAKKAHWGDSWLSTDETSNR